MAVNIYRANREAVDFRARVRRVLLKEIGDLVWYPLQKGTVILLK